MRTHHIRLSTRRKQELARRMRNRLATLAVILLLGTLAASPNLRNTISETVRNSIETISSRIRTAQTELTLPAMHIYALQLGVYDNGELAQQEQQRLTDMGMPCIVWQREHMHLICAAALNMQALESAKTSGLETYVFEDEMPEVQIRLSASEQDVGQVAALFALPDTLFFALQKPESAEPFDALIQRAKDEALPALTSHPENTLYTQLAQSLSNWCILMEQTAAQTDVETLRHYAAATICTLCRELRVVLCRQTNT